MSRELFLGIISLILILSVTKDGFLNVSVTRFPAQLARAAAACEASGNPGASNAWKEREPFNLLPKKVCVPLKKPWLLWYNS